MSVLLEGLLYTVLGLAVVFVGLSILIGCIALLRAIVHKDDQPKIIAPSHPTPAAIPDVDTNPDGALVAAITAAISVMLQAEKGQEHSTGFVVRRIRRIPTRDAWSRAGREEQLFSRM